MATISPDDGDVVHALRPQKKLKSIPWYVTVCSFFFVFNLINFLKLLIVSYVIANSDP